MPITVIVCSMGGDESPLTFDGAQRVVLGRGAGSDVRLPDASVSHRHASVRSQGTELVVVDEGSTNGTFVGDVRVAPGMSRIVRSGDWVRLGRVWLRLLMDPNPVTRDLAMATRDLALAFVSQAMRARGADRTMTVRVVEGRDQGATLPLADEGRSYAIGRGSDCDLPLADVDASREHVRVVRRGAGVVIRDAGAKNGTWLGTVRLATNEEVSWRPTQMLQVGRSVLALVEPVGAALAEIEQREDELMDPVATPAEPSALGPLALAARDAAGGAGPSVAPRVSSTEPDGPTVRRPKRTTWSVLDLLVMGAALGVLALSLAGIFWLLRG
jgi:pSer/pThr/pTyr-binding forkhead associated (FHA) protein